MDLFYELANDMAYGIASIRLREKPSTGPNSHCSREAGRLQKPRHPRAARRRADRRAGHCE